VRVTSKMTQQSTGPTWTRLLTIALYLLFASLPALSFAVFYALLWQGNVNTSREAEMANSPLKIGGMGGMKHSGAGI